jgi:hypothetical protein
MDITGSICGINGEHMNFENSGQDEKIKISGDFVMDKEKAIEICNYLMEYYGIEVKKYTLNKLE